TLGTLSAGTNYSLSLASASFEITAKAVTITPDAGQHKTFGATDPTLTYTNSERLLAASSTGGELRATGDDEVSNALTLGAPSAGSNYSLSLAPASFEITTKAVTITPTSGQHKTFGATDPTLTYTFSPTLQTGDSFSGELSRATGENVGNYAITLGTLSAGSNYSLSLAPASFEITAKAVTITAAPGQHKTFGSL